MQSVLAASLTSCRNPSDKSAIISINMANTKKTLRVVTRKSVQVTEGAASVTQAGPADGAAAAHEDASEPGPPTQTPDVFTKDDEANVRKRHHGLISAKKIDGIVEMSRVQSQVKPLGGSVGLIDQLVDANVRIEANNTERQAYHHDLGSALNEGFKEGELVGVSEILRSKHAAGELPRPNEESMNRANEYHKVSTPTFACNAIATNLQDPPARMGGIDGPQFDANNESASAPAGPADAAAARAVAGHDAAVSAGGASPEQQEDQADELLINVAATNVPMLLLHRSIPTTNGDHENAPYSDFMNADVNLRKRIEQSKLNCTGSANLFQAFVVNRQADNSPIIGQMTAAVSSYSVVREQEEENAQSVKLHSVNCKAYDRTVVAKTLTVDVLTDALKWLDHNRYNNHTVQDVRSGMGEYLKALRRVNIDGDVQHLTEFIRDHNWELQHDCGIWHPEIASDLEAAMQAVPPLNKKRILRRFIHENLAKLTKILLLLSDGLHRSAVVDGATTGVAPPGATEALKRELDEFQSTLDSGFPFLKLLSVSMKFPKHQLDQRFCAHMLRLSGTNQLSQTLAEPHTSKHVVLSFIRLVRDEMAVKFRPGFLVGKGVFGSWLDPQIEKDKYGTGEWTNDMRKGVFVALVVESKFDPKEVELYCKDLSFDKDHEIGEHYIKFWVQQFQAFLRTTLLFIHENNRHFSGIAPEIGIEEIAKKSISWWENIFKYKNDSGRGDKGYGDFDPFPNSYKKTMLFSLLVRPSSKCPFDDSNRYLRTGYEATHLEFVWIVLWSFLSEDTFDTVTRFLSEASPDASLYPQGSVGSKPQTTRFFTCLVQVISCSVYASKEVWNRGFVHKNRRNNFKFNHIGACGLHVLLLMSAADHSIKCFAKIGIDPQPEWFRNHQFFENPPWQEQDCHAGDWELWRLLKKDLLVLITTVFCVSLGIDSMNVQSKKTKVGNYNMTRRLEKSLRADFPDGRTLFHQDSDTKLLVASGVATFGGRESYDLRRKVPGQPGQPDQPGAIMLQVVGISSSTEGGMEHTHRLGEFMEHEDNSTPFVNQFSMLDLVGYLFRHRHITRGKKKAGGAGGGAAQHPEGGGGGGTGAARGGGGADPDGRAGGTGGGTGGAAARGTDGSRQAGKPDEKGSGPDVNSREKDTKKKSRPRGQKRRGPPNPPKKVREAHSNILPTIMNHALYNLPPDMESMDPMDRQRYGILQRALRSLAPFAEVYRAFAIEQQDGNGPGTEFLQRVEDAVNAAESSAHQELPNLGGEVSSADQPGMVVDVPRDPPLVRPARGKGRGKQLIIPAGATIGVDPPSSSESSSSDSASDSDADTEKAVSDSAGEEPERARKKARKAKSRTSPGSHESESDGSREELEEKDDTGEAKLGDHGQGGASEDSDAPRILLYPSDAENSEENSLGQGSFGDGGVEGAGEFGEGGVVGVGGLTNHDLNDLATGYFSHKSNDSN